MTDKIRLGFVGANVNSTWSVQSHFPALIASPDVEMTAVCTSRPESAEEARQAFGAKLAFHDFRTMVVSPEIDAVAVVVRVPLHYEPTKAAIEAGKHVFTEWPLGRTTAEAEELAALAKAKGLRTVGIAGGAEKCKIATRDFGFDVCLDHRAYDDAKSLRAALKDACPKGIDIYFENVGGKVLEAVIPMMNPHGRIPICGMIAWYNAGGLGAGAAEEALTAPKLWRTILVNFLSVNGFIISNHWNNFPKFLKEVAPKVADGTIAVKEDITEGLENAPQAFMDLLTGGNQGKAIVKVG